MPNLNVRVSGRAIVFIDPKVEDYQSLIAGVKPGAEVVILDADRDAIDQITQVLAWRANIDSIHIVSHGAPGSLQLGNGWLSADNLSDYSQQLQQWQNALSVGADILIYGCNVAGVSRIFPTVRQGINSLSHSESRLKPTACTNINMEVICGVGRVYLTCLLPSKSLANPPLQIFEIGAISDLKPTENEVTLQSSLEDFRYETGVLTPGGSGASAINFESAIELEPASNQSAIALESASNESAIELDGFTFIKRIAQLTNANVAASKNLTGSAAKGGDWELEVRTGKINTPLIFREDAIASYNHVLSSFSTAINFSAGLAGTETPISLGTGDFNGDTFLDLAVANLNSRDISILLGTGTGSFGTATSLFNPGNEIPNSITVRDFNGDNNLDLAVANPLSGVNGNFVSIRLGAGNGSFSNPTNFGAGINPRSIAAGDFNGDSNLDLVTAPLSGNNLSILLGDGTGSFSNPVNIINSVASLSVVTADLNGDSKLDLVTSNNTATNNLSVFLGDGAGNFSAPVNFSAGTGNHFVVTGDFNSDSKLDLAVSNTASNNISVLLGDGTGNFGTATNFSVGSSPESVVAGDFNSDGKLDLVASNGGSNNVSVLLGDGTGSFGTAVNFSVGTVPRFIAAGDFNGDSKLDLATPNFTSKNVSILVNTPNTVNFGAATFSATEGITDTVINIPVTISGGTPLNDVVVQIAIDPSSTATQNSDYTFSPTSITFPAGATGTALTQNIAFTIKPDNVAENAETAILNFGTITGGVADTTKQTTLTIATNGTVSYGIVAGTASISEGNTGTTPLTFTATRSGDTGGASSVNYAIAGTATNVSDYNNIGGTSGATGIAGTINFTAGETSRTITLNILGDTIVEPDETIAITLSNPTSAGLTPTITTATATTTITNDDTVGVTVNPITGLTTSEVGGKASFTVKLNSQPSADVTFGLSSDNVAEGIVATNSLTFTPANYNLPQTVTVTGIDDLAADGDRNYKIVTAAAVSTDPNYNNLNPDDVAVTNNDNETPGITVNPTAGLTTNEVGDKANFDVVLNTQPTADVTVGLNSSNTAEGTVSTNSLTFTPANWNVPQQVTVTGVDDSITDGNIDYKIITAAAVSTDPNYNNRDVADVSITNQDNDTLGVSVSPTETKATEGGANGSYDIKLTSQPIAPVTFNLTTDNQVEPIAPLTFTPNNWNIAQTVAVKAVDDAIVEGAHNASIAHNVTSTDVKYNGIVVPGVIVAIADNDTVPPPPPPPTPTVTPVPTPIPTPPTPTPPTPTPTPPTPTPTPTPTVIPDPQNNWCGLEAGLNKLENILDDQLNTIKVPIVGSLKNIAPNFIDSFKNKLVDAVKNGVNQTTDQLETTLGNVLGSDFKVKVNKDSTPDESTLLITLGKAYQSDANLAQNLGLPGLGLSTDGKAKSTANFDLAIAVGVHKDFGCFIDTEKTKLMANFDAGLDDKSKAQANLGIVQIDLNNNPQKPTKAEAKLAVNLQDLDNLGGANDGSRLTLSELDGNYQLSDLFDANLTANANLGLQAKTSINNNPAFPSLSFDLGANWQAINYTNGLLTAPQKPTVNINNVAFNWGQTLQGLEASLNRLQDSLTQNLLEVKLPILGKLKDVIPGDSSALNFLNTFKDRTIDELKVIGDRTLSSTLYSLVQDSLDGNFNSEALGSKLTFQFTQKFSEQIATNLQAGLTKYFPPNKSVSGFSLPSLKVIGQGTPDDINLEIALDKNYEFPDVNLSGDLGIPALGLDVNGKAQSKFDGNLSLGFGINKDFGFYVDTNKTKLEANVEAGLDNDFNATGKLGFFQVDLANDNNNPTKAEAKFAVKLNDLDNLGGNDDGSRLTFSELTSNNQLSDLLDTTLNSSANLGLKAKTSINGNAAIPSFNFDLGVNWPIVNYANGALTGPQKPTVDLNNVKLDLGTFVSKFSKPVIGKIYDVLQPFQPVAKLLNADTKLISKIGLAKLFDQKDEKGNKDGKVTVLELAEALFNKKVDTRFLDGIKNIENLKNLANQISTNNSGLFLDLGSYRLGNFNATNLNSSTENASFVNTNISASPNQQINSKAEGNVKKFLNNLTGIEGFDIPLLTKPKNAVKLLLGKSDVNLFTYDMPKLGFDFDVPPKKFRMWGVISGLLKGKFSAYADLGFGYDTYGLQQWKNSGFDSRSATKVLDGFYVSDRDRNGRDVDELKLKAQIDAGGGVDVWAASGYLTGGIKGEVGIDFVDKGEKNGTSDGKIRASEISERINKPSELFKVKGKIEASLDGEASLLGKKWETNFATFKLADFSLGSNSSKKGSGINSYMTGATVFFDGNFNGIKDDSEPFTITNADGSFDLDVSLDDFDLNNSGDLEPEEGIIVMIDGINTSTYLPQQTPLYATPDAIVVTPLTTLLTELVLQGTDQNQAQIQVKSALGLPPTIDLTSYDPLEAITENDPNGLAVYAAHAQVQNTIVLITNLISGAANTAKNEIASSVISAIADRTKFGSLDLSNSTQLQAIIQSATSQLQVPQLANISSDAAQIIAEGNQRIKAASSNSSPSDAATEIARIQKVAQGEVAQDLQQVAAGNKTIQSAIAENTGASLNTQIQSATVDNPTVRDNLNTDDSSEFTPDESFPDSGIEFVKDGENTANTTDGDDTIIGSASDDILRGKKGNDLLYGFDGNDWINGNQGNDVTDGGIGDDTLYGGKGFDSLTGAAGNDFMFGNRGEDILIGEKGDDSLRGGQGNDILLGGQGNDFLSGDLGDDTLVGDVGNDRFLLSTNSGIDTIADFEDGIDLIALDSGLTFSQLSITDSNSLTLIRLSATNEILATLNGVTANQISIVDFS
jgi:Domain of unknown function (DUF4347)/FG-GAP-like repeat/RTX calcium-binding nonapeptide repeat (4 copies)/Calx-beta domain